MDNQTHTPREKKTKFVIVIPHYDLKDLKKIYSNFNGDTSKISKQMIADWISDLVTADIDSINSI